MALFAPPTSRFLCANLSRHRLLLNTAMTETQIQDPLFSDLVRWRRYVHQHPELSYHESETATYVEEELRKLGVTDISGFFGN